MRLGRRLRFPTRPHGDETLIGLVARATAEHVLLDVNGTLRRAGISMDQPGNVSKLPVDSLRPLADILGCSAADVATRSTTLVAPDARSSRLRFGRVTVSPQDVEWTRRRISPISLAGSPHHREAWLLRLLPYCPTSFELLRSDCSECGGRLGWKKTVGIAECERCERTVRSDDSPLLPMEFRAAYSRFADLFSCSRGVDAVGGLESGAGLIDPGELVELVLEIGACVHLPERRIEGRKRFHRMPAQEAARIVATGMDLVTNWPTRLQDWARSEAERLRGSPTEYLRLRHALRRLGARARVSPARAELARAAFPDLFCNVQRSFAAPGEGLLRFEAAELLGVTMPTITQLVDAKALDVQFDITGKRRMVRLARSAVVDLRDRLAGSVTLAQLSRSTGLPGYALENLRQLGELVAEDHPAIPLLRGGRSVTAESYASIEADLRSGGSPTDRPADALPISTASRLIGGRLKPWPAIIAALRSGSLEYWLDAERAGQPWLRRMLVRQADMGAFLSSAARSFGGKPFTIEECLLSDAREILNLNGTPSVDLRTILAEEIAARPQRGLSVMVPVATVLAIATSTISIAEICARRGWNPRQAKWQLKPFASVRNACGWERKAIEASLLDVPASRPPTRNTNSPERPDGPNSR